MVKSDRGSQIIVDPQELTEFLRSSRDVTELAETALKLDIENNLTNQCNKGEITQEEFPKQNAKRGFKRFAGIAFALGAGICLQIANVIVKMLDNHHPVNLVFWRYFALILPAIPYLVVVKIVKNVNLFSSIVVTGDAAESSPYPGRCVPPAKCRSVLRFFVVSALGIPVFILRFASLHYLTIADSTVIVYSGSLFTIIFGHFFLKEKCGFVTVPISCFTLLGVVVISRPTFFTGKDMDDNVLIGVGLTFFSTILAAMYFITTRQLRQVHFMVISLGSGLMGVLITGSVVWAMGVFRIPEGVHEILLVALLGLMSFLGSCMIVAALKFEEAGTVSIVRMVDVLYSFLFQFAWFGVVPDVYSISGAIIVMTGVSLITFRKILSTLPETHRLRTAFFFLLL